MVWSVPIREHVRRHRIWNICHGALRGNRGGSGGNRSAHVINHSYQEYQLAEINYIQTRSLKWFCGSTHTLDYLLVNTWRLHGKKLTWHTGLNLPNGWAHTCQPAYMTQPQTQPHAVRLDHSERRSRLRWSKLRRVTGCVWSETQFKSTQTSGLIKKTGNLNLSSKKTVWIILILWVTFMFISIYHDKNRKKASIMMMGCLRRDASQ